MVEIFKETFYNEFGFFESRSLFSDGGSDYFGLINPGVSFDFDGDPTANSVPAYTGLNGSFLAGQDMDEDSTSNNDFTDQSVSFITSSSIDISGFHNLSFEGLFAEFNDGSSGQWEFNDLMRVEIDIDGTGFFTVLDLRSETGSSSFLAVDKDGNGFGDGTRLGAAAQVLTADLDLTGNNLRYRFTAVNDSGGEDFAVDDFAITGDVAPFSLSLSDSTINEGETVTLTVSRTDTVGDLTIDLSNTNPHLAVLGAASVTLLDGQASATVDFTSIENNTLQILDTDIVISGSAAGDTISVPVTVFDDDDLLEYSEGFSFASGLRVRADGSTIDFFSDNSSDYFGLTAYNGPVDFGSGARTNSSDLSFVGLSGAYLTGQDLDGEGATLPVTVQKRSSTGISGTEELMFSGQFAIQQPNTNGLFDAGDLITVEASIDGGAFFKILQFAAEGDQSAEALALDTNFDGIGDGEALSNIAKTFHAQIAGTGSSLEIRTSFTINSDEPFAVDTFSVVGVRPGTEIFSESFNSDAGFTKSKRFFSDGSADYLGITDNGSFNDFDGDGAPGSDPAYTDFEGRYLVGQDLDEDNVGGRTLTDQGLIQLDWNDIDISGFHNLVFSGLFAETNNGRSAVHDFNDLIRIEAQIDGTGYQTVLDLRQDDDDGVNGFLRKDTDGDGIGDGLAKLGTAAYQFSGDILGTGSLLDLRFIAVSNVGGEDFAADEFRITGDAAPFSISLDSNLVTEGGTATLTVTRTDTSSSAGFAFDSSDPALIGVPVGSRTLLAGQDSFTQTINIADDDLLQALDRNGTISVTSNGTTISVPVVITDDERISVYSESFANASNITVLNADGSTGDFFSDNSGDYFGITSYDGAVDFGTGSQTNNSNISFLGMEDAFLTGQDMDADGVTLPVAIQNTTLIDITDLESLTFTGDFATLPTSSTRLYDADDFIKVEASIDGGAFFDVLHLRASGDQSNEPLAVDTDFDGVGDGEVVGLDAKTFTADIAGTGSTLQLRTSFAFPTSGEEFAADNFQVFGKDAAETVFFEDFDDSSDFTSSKPFFTNDLVHQDIVVSRYLGLHDGTNAIDFGTSRDPLGPELARYSDFDGSFLTGMALHAGVQGEVHGYSIATLDWTDIDISGFHELSFGGLFAGNAGTFDIKQYNFMRIEAQIDGTGYIDVLHLVGGPNNSFTQDTDFDGAQDGAAVSTSASTFLADIAETGSLLDLRFTAFVSSNQDFAVDSFEIKGKETPLTLVFDANALTESESTTATITRTGDTSGDLTVSLSTSDSAVLDIPATVVIPDGHSSATFTVTASDNLTIQNSDQRETISATALGATISSALVVSDDERTTLFNETFDVGFNSQPNVSQSGDFYSASFGHFGVVNPDGVVDFGADRGGSLANYTGFDGAFLSGSDMDSVGQALPVTLEWSSIDIAGFDTLTFAGDFAQNTFLDVGLIDPGDLITIEVAIDGGAFETVLQFASNGTANGNFFAVDSDFDGIGDGAVLDNDPETFLVAIAGTGSTASIRASFSVDDSREAFAVDDFQIFGKGPPIIRGDENDNFLTGSDVAETFIGGGGSDIVLSGDGDDNAEGGEGPDALAGQVGNDTLDGGAGDDLLDGGEDSDLLYAGGDDDFLYGGPGEDSLFGGGDNDDLFGGEGGDSLFGGEGSDSIDGGSGNDTLDGGPGDDIIVVDTADDVTDQQPGEGYDRVLASASVTLGDHVEAGNLTGSDDLSMTAASTGSWIQGNAGNNTLLGQGGADRLDGNAGDDTIDGGAGNDVQEGGSGADVFVLSEGLDLILDFEDGTDLIDLTVQGIRFEDLAVVQNGLNVLLTHGNGSLGINNLDVADLSAADFIEPLASTPPVVAGTQGNDNLTQAAGPIEIQGLGGNDLLRAFTGSATLVGGNGDDQYYVYEAGTVITELAGEGTDLVRSQVDLVLSENVENASEQGSTGVDITGNALGNAITGSAGSNVLTGEAGNDRLRGRDGADTLDGGTGNDILEGGAGDGAADVFVFELGDGTDTVRDFELGLDKIDLTATGLAFGDLTINGSVNAVVQYGGDLLVVEGVTAIQLTSDQFDFAL